MRRAKTLLLTALTLAVTAANSAQAQTTYYLMHGLNDTPGVWNTFQNRVPTGNTISAAQYQSMTQGIAQQADQLNSEVNEKSGSWKPYALVGHSQGGLRARYYAQYMATQTGKANNLKGLMTIGSPNNGAPIINNGPALITRIDRDVAIASIGLLNVGAAIITGYGSLQSAPALSFLYSRPPGVADLDPQSEFLKKLNNTKTIQANCRWASSGWGWWTSWYQICDTVPDPGNAPIPANVMTASIIGTNNSLFNAFPEGRAYRNYAVGVGTTIAVGWSAAAFFTFGATIPMAAAAWGFVYIAGNAENLWGPTVVGSTEGDFIVPRRSQNIYAANPNLGGRGQYTYVVNATHLSQQPGVAETTHNDSRIALVDFHERLNR